MRLNVLICCYDSSVNGVPAIMMPFREDVRYVVSHQMSREYFEVQKDIPDGLNRQDVVYAPFVGKGLSANRNHCLDIVSGLERIVSQEEICLIADDDVTYYVDSFDNILSAFAKNNDIDIASFRIKTPEGQPMFKMYPDKAFIVNRIPLWGKFYFSSVEVAFRFDSVCKIRFDEDFGVGSGKWSEGGEETIFLSDCLKNGLKMMYIPEYIVGHDYMSSGKARKTVRKARMMLAVACRCRGLFSLDAFVGILRVLYRLAIYPFITLYRHIMSKE